MRAWFQLVSAIYNFTLIHRLNGSLLIITPSNGSVNTTGEKCTFEKHVWLTEKLILISITGTTIAVFGIMGNVTTAIVLTRPSMRTPNNLYLTFLALFDTLLLISAVVLYSVEYIYEYTDNLSLYIIWLGYVRYGFAVSHVAQTGSVYITVSVTFERLLAVIYPKQAKSLCTHDRASLTILIVVIFAVLFNCTKYFETEVIHLENCTGFSAHHLEPSALLRNSIYTTVHSLWLTQFVMVFFPFIVLFAVNTAIAYRVRRSLKKLSWIQRGRKRDKLKERSKDATRVLIVIVVVFLLCNSLGFVVTLLENLYSQDDLKAWCPGFYAFAREAINFLAIVNSSINFLIYYIFGQDFRRELVCLWGCRAMACMVPEDDKFAAERLIADTTTSLHPAPPSAFECHVGLSRRLSAGQFSQISSNRNKRKSEARRQPNLSNIKGILASAQQPTSNGPVSGGRTVVITTLTSADDEDHRNAKGTCRESKTTGLSNGGLVDRQLLCPTVNSARRSASRSDLKISPECDHSDRRRSSVVQQYKECDISRSGSNTSCTDAAEPLAPFLLGMLISTAPTVRQAGLQATIERYENETDDLNWV